QVLPELGEHNMVQLTYYQYVNRRVPRLQVASIQERFDADQEGVNARASQLLTSLTYFKAVTRYAKRLGRDGHLRFKNLMFNKKVFFSKDKIAELYYSFNQNYNLGNRLDATKQELVKMLNRRISGEMRSKWVEERIQTLSKEELDVIYHEYGGEFKDEEAENKYLARRIVMEAFKPIKKAIDHNRWMNINAQYIHLLRVTPKLVKLADFGLTEDEWASYVDDQLAALKEKRMSANGISVYLYLYDLLTGKRGQREIRFVFVDEVQDYDAFQLAYLKFCFPKARFTLLGDLNQAIFTHNNARSLLQQLGTMFEPEKTKVIQLTRSYRSTKQITNFTKAILKDGEAIEAFEREGELPRVLTAPSEEDAVNQVVATLAKYQADHDTTAIITKTLTDAEKITALLKEAGQAVTLIQTENQRLAQGTIVVPSYLAKGLEFDAVIVWDANQAKYQGDAERQLVYTICSRAMHALTVTSVGPVTDLIGQIPGELYQTK
ncbi:ATP-binding domain-containing protein, partial [Limosilactobacillus fermentum]